MTPPPGRPSSGSGPSASIRRGGGLGRRQHAAHGPATVTEQHARTRGAPAVHLFAPLLLCLLIAPGAEALATRLRAPPLPPLGLPRAPRGAWILRGGAYGEDGADQDHLAPSADATAAAMAGLSISPQAAAAATPSTLVPTSPSPFPLPSPCFPYCLSCAPPSFPRSPPFAPPRLLCRPPTCQIQEANKLKEEGNLLHIDGAYQLAISR